MYLLEWSDDAIEDYHGIIDNLLARWPESVAMDFVEQVDTVIGVIRSHPDAYPLSDYLSIRKAVVVKQVSLFYRVDGDTLRLVRFWENRRDPSSLKM